MTKAETKRTPIDFIKSINQHRGRINIGVEVVFQKELSQIHDKEIKQFVITCFDKLCPDYFWTCPCSTTGKYHPKVSLGVGGLVRHTKLAVWWGIELIHALGPSPELKDIPTLQDEVIATLLLHDMIKNGKGLNAKGFPLDRGVTGTHGVTLYKTIRTSSIYLHDGDDNEDAYFRILHGIASHMGIWTTDPKHRPNSLLHPPNKAFANLIHLADYCASRKVDEIYYKLETEITHDFIKKSTTNKTEVSQSPACPGVRKCNLRHVEDEATRDVYL